MASSTPLPAPSGGTVASADIVATGLPIPPIERIRIFSSGQWEDFVLEWADSLRDQYGTADARQWPEHQRCTPELVAALTDPAAPEFEAVAFHFFVQYHLHLQLRDAADYAHGRGVIHRDVKPANFLLSGEVGPEERVLLADFGIARALDDAAMTAAGSVVATAAFAAPAVYSVTLMRTWADFAFVELCTLPMFLFSATFVPIDDYPTVAQWIVPLTPLYHGVHMLRAFTLGEVSWTVLLNIAYLVAMTGIFFVLADRRLAKLLLK